MRVAVVDKERCRSDRCDLVCIRFCPMVRSRREAIRLEGGKAYVAESLCSGCGICIRKCPFDALMIVNLPDELESDHIHRFGPNAFTLYRLPVPRRGAVVGLLGRNGIGKTTVLRILAGDLRPNLGALVEPLSEEAVVERFAGLPLHDYLDGLYRRRIKVAYKPQYVDRIPEVVSGTVGEVLGRLDERDVLRDVAGDLEIGHILDRELGTLSGGELQRVAIATAVCRDADVYLFDEPSSHLDIYQRMRAARVIRGLIDDGRMVLAAEHDLAALDYLSEDIFLIYGEPDVYGIVSNIHGVREGINIYINGYIPDENVRFRPSPIVFHVKPPTPPSAAGRPMLGWTELRKSFGEFDLTVDAGEIGEGEVIGILGENGIGKTTFIRMLAGVEEPDGGGVSGGEVKVSYKPQYLSRALEGTVEEVLRRAAGSKYGESWFRAEVVEPLHVRRLLERDVEVLSGGELQRAAIAECLSRTADIYLLDEPSAYLDVEERLAMARAIRRITKMSGVTAFVVEHDIVAQDFIADRLMVFTGDTGRRGFGGRPMRLEEGMNAFLREMGITFRRDPETKRPRVNKEGSKLDREQKKTGRYYYVK
ncbi:MAG: ribosome biogenesis/translation initiation ATPase RLI [Candidatus Bathyarchaeota archaeon]|nr:ribosome biogenesis/translation initiation ATPase RLI [Candidatus Bathyarchaeota archaeon]